MEVIKLKLSEILKHVQYKEIYNEIELDIESVGIDSREVVDVFIGVKGANSNGSDYYLNALENGAKLAVINRKLKNKEINYLKDNQKVVIYVNDPIIFLHELAIYKRSLYDIPVLAITGSNGKTSTKDMIYSVLKTKYNVLKTEGNLNNHLGVPLTILCLRDHDFLILEMGMNHLGELSILSNIAKPTMALITNIGTAHIGNLGSRENILFAKLEIISGMKEKRLVLNNDDEYLNMVTKEMPTITYGINNDSKYQGKIIEETEDGTLIECNGVEIKVPIPGVHYVYNALAGFTVGREFNIPNEDIKKGIETFDLTKGRMEVIKRDDITIINDTYNANYDSMKYALINLNKYPGRKIAVLGDMGELGSYTEYYHRSLGMEIVDKNIDILVTVGDSSKYINDEAIKRNFNKENSYHFENKEDAIELLNKIKLKNDIILIKASRTSEFEIITQNI